MSVNRQALDREPIPIRRNSSRGEYVDHPCFVGRGGFGTYAKAYSWVIESRSSKSDELSRTRWGSKRLACDCEFFHALKDIQSLYVVFKRKEEVLERPRTDRERIFPG